MNTSHNKNRVVDHGWKNVFKNLIRCSNDDFPGTEGPKNKNNKTVVRAIDNTQVEHRDDKNDIFTMTTFYSNDSIIAECGSPINYDDVRLNCPSKEQYPSTSKGQNREKFKKCEYVNLDVNKLPAKQVNIYPTAHKIVSKMIKNLHREEKYIEYFKCLLVLIEESKKGKSVSEFELASEFSTGSCKASVYNEQQNKEVKDKHKKTKSSRNVICATHECPRSSSVAKNDNLQNNNKGRIEDRIAKRSKILAKISASYGIEETYNALMEKLINLEEHYLNE